MGLFSSWNSSRPHLHQPTTVTLDSGLLPHSPRNDNPVKSVRIPAKNFGFGSGMKSIPLYAVWCIDPSFALLDT